MGRGISVSKIGAGLNIFIVSRATARNPGPHPQGNEPPSDFHVHGHGALGRKVTVPPYLPLMSLLHP